MLNSLSFLALSLSLLTTAAQADILRTYSFQTGVPDNIISNSAVGPNQNPQKGLAGTFTENITAGKFESWYIFTTGGGSLPFSDQPINGFTLNILNNNLNNGLWQSSSGFGVTEVLQLAPMGQGGWGVGNTNGAFLTSQFSDGTYTQYTFNFFSTFVEEIDTTLAPPTAAVPEPETLAMVLLGLAAMGVVARRRKAKRTA